MSLWVWVIVIGLLTYGLRLSFILLVGRWELPPAAARVLRFVPPAVLGALIAPALLAPAGAPDLSPGNARLVAGLLAIAVAWRTRNALLTMLAGMGALLLLQALIH
jgi:branched-subunit amino acid transport protein